MLVEYEINMEELVVDVVNNVSTAKVKIIFSRRMEYHVTNTILQTMILVTVGAYSFFFRVGKVKSAEMMINAPSFNISDNFTDRIMVTLTVM